MGLATYACGGLVLLSVGVAIGLEAGEPLIVTLLAWISQVVTGFTGWMRARAALRRIDQLQLPVEMVVQLQLRRWRVISLIGAILGLIGGLVVVALGVLLAMALSGSVAGAWGRPLRFGGKEKGATLGDFGYDWAEGPRPGVEDLDAPTREALGRMWLHDAKKEHGSVPAFAQVTWQLAMLGAPAGLLERCHHAALQEIEHTRRCFALSGTYLGRSIGVGPIEGLPARLPYVGNRTKVAITVALESLEDGCLIEDLNADFAERAAVLAVDPAAKALATTIAREEREHAELAWDILRWCVELDAKVRTAVAARVQQLPHKVLVPYSIETMECIRRADGDALTRHARVPLEEWARIHHERREATVARVEAMLAEPSRVLPRISASTPG